MLKNILLNKLTFIAPPDNTCLEIENAKAVLNSSKT